MSSIGIILGSAFHSSTLAQHAQRLTCETPYGVAHFEHFRREDGVDVYLLFRHGRPHSRLPNQINYRANARALADLGVKALLVTSSVGVLDAEVPVNSPLIVDDLLMPDNRLPDGSACTMFEKPTAHQGHLVLEDGIVSTELTRQLENLVVDEWGDTLRVTFGYVAGPRTKTAAENRMWAAWGAQVNSMTVGPELVLANELEVPCASLVIGHKYSHPDIPNPDPAGVTESLERARKSFESLVHRFGHEIHPVEPANSIYRFDSRD